MRHCKDAALRNILLYKGCIRQAARPACPARSISLAVASWEKLFPMARIFISNPPYFLINAAAFIRNGTFLKTVCQGSERKFVIFLKTQKNPLHFLKITCIMNSSKNGSLLLRGALCSMHVFAQRNKGVPAAKPPGRRNGARRYDNSAHAV